MPRNKNPFFSIITVTKNSEKTLERTIESLKNQTFKNFEHIIIDGKSSDGTLRIIKKNKNIIDFFLSKKDKNMWEAINTGIKNSKGKIIGILNSDDVLNSNGLEIVWKYFNIKKLDFLCASVKKKKIHHGFDPKKLRYKFNFFPSHSVGFYIKKDIHKKIGLYDSDLKYCADYDLIYRLIKNKYKGDQTSKSEVVGRFYSGGISEKISFITSMYYQAKVRFKNNENIIYVLILSLNHIFYYYTIKFLKVIKKTFRLTK